MNTKKQELHNALFLGSFCSVAYLAVYVARNTLSAVTPHIIETTSLTEQYIGNLSSLYFIFYAIGQLINGALGDKIKARYMITLGPALAGISNILFCYLVDLENIALIVYPLTGFFLAMIYGPMVKVVSENTNVVYAERCSLGYTFSSFFGSPLAGVLASFLAWQSVFKVSSAALFVMAVSCFVCFIFAERRGIVKYNQFKKQKSRDKAGITVLLKRQIIKFTFISILTGVVRTTVVFWMPTYFSQNLGYSAEQLASIFTVTTLVNCLTAFITIYIYERLKRNVDLTTILMFGFSFQCFIIMFFTRSLPIVNIACLVLGIMAANGASTMIWSIYCPSLFDTGMVSTATGFLDFVSYAAASVASKLFANAVTAIGWNNLILIYMGRTDVYRCICGPAL